MFSYFFSTNKAKHSILMQQPCRQGWISDMKVLPNGLILSWTSIKALNLELYDPVKKIKVASCHIAVKGISYLVCMSRERLLFCNKKEGVLYVFNSYTLERDEKLEEILKTQKMDFEAGIYLGEQQFITKSKRIYGENSLVSSHDLSTMKFYQPVSMGWPCKKSSLKDLENGLFACQLGYYDDKIRYHIGLFKRKSGPNIEFTQIGSLYPNKQDSGFGYEAGHFIGLPDGKVLTYHEAGDHFQVWQSDGKCVDEWTWHKDIICDDNVFRQDFLNRDVAPLPDNEHLLILADTHHHTYIHKLFLFNMKTRVIKPVEFNGLDPWRMKVLANGQVAVHMMDKNKKNHMLCIDFAEMLAYRKGVTAHLNTYLSPDVNRLVTSYISDPSPWVVDEEKKPNKGWSWW
ncbi:MAG: hypothetical protein ACYCQI_11395 [Gammaproteobacteria bacterium]